MRVESLLALAIPLSMCFRRADAVGLYDPQICYILDAILFLYGLVLTTLYCRLKGTEEELYTGLTHAPDPYEMIGIKT